MKSENRKAWSVFAPAAKENWLQRIGLAGFLFFLAKGLLWIAAAAWVAY